MNLKEHIENMHDAEKLKAALLVAVEALEKYTDLHHAPKLEEALEEIERIKG